MQRVLGGGGCSCLRFLEWGGGAAATTCQHDDAYGVVDPAGYTPLPSSLLRELQLVEHEHDPTAAPQQEAELRVGAPAARVVGAAPRRGAAPLVGEQRAVPHAALAQCAQHAAVEE